MAVSATADDNNNGVCVWLWLSLFTTMIFFVYTITSWHLWWPKPLLNTQTISKKINMMALWWLWSLLITTIISKNKKLDHWPLLIISMI